MLLQTGYLTIKDYNPKTRKYVLGIPNEEVRLSFDKNLLASFTYLDEPDVDNYLEKIRQALEESDLQQFVVYLKSLLANIPYYLHLQEEKYYHSLFQLIGNLLGGDIHSEIATNKGRIDLVITTKKYLYLFEFKFNQSSEKALKQIEAKKYYEKYLGQKKKIVLIGVSFNRTEHDLNIDYISKSI